MVRALVTGGAGFIGYHLGQFLAAQGYEVTLCDNLSRGRRDQELDELLRGEKVKFIACDLTRPEELAKLGRGYHQVYHLAAINGTRYFYEIPHTVLRVNLLTLINVLEWFVSSGCGKLFFSSSSEVYAGTSRIYGIAIPTPEGVPLTVDDIYNPRLSYATSKMAGELLCLNYKRAYGFPVSIARYHNVYGPRMGYEHVIPEFCQRIQRRENPFQIFGGEESRAFCYVNDAVRASHLVMDAPLAQGQVINIGNDQEEITIRQLASLMFDLFDLHPEVEVLAAPLGSVKRRCPDIAKLRQLTGYEPQVDLATGLRRTFEWYRSAVTV